MEDLAVIARIRVSDNGSITVTDGVCEQLHMSGEEILEAAHRNTECQEFTCQSIEDIMRSIMRAEGLPERYLDDVIDSKGMEVPLYVLTNKEMSEGAAVITSRNVLEQAREKLGEDYWILPSSRHEVLLAPKSIGMDAETLKEIVGQVNGREVSRADKLSDNVYQYNGLTRKITMADTLSLDREKDKTVKVVKSHARSH